MGSIELLRLCILLLRVRRARLRFVGSRLTGVCHNGEDYEQRTQQRMPSGSGHQSSGGSYEFGELGLLVGPLVAAGFALAVGRATTLGRTRPAVPAAVALVSGGGGIGAAWLCVAGGCSARGDSSETRSVVRVGGGAGFAGAG